MPISVTLSLNPVKITVGTNVAQVDTVTLTGTSGTATITAGGISRTATFNTSLTQTATDFDTTHSADFTAVGITVTTSGADIIFTSATAGTPFTSPVIVNVTGNLAGTVVNTTANNSVSADIDFENVLPHKQFKGLTGYALIDWISGTSIQFSCNGEEITASSGAITTSQPRMILPLTRAVALKHKGAGGEEYNLTIVGPDFS